MEEAVTFAKTLKKRLDIIQKIKRETLAPILNVIDDAIVSLSGDGR